MNREIAIGTVVYKPNANVMLRLQSARAAGFSVYVFDNSPQDAAIRDCCRKCEPDAIKYSTCGKNVGLGFGISSVCAQAYYDSHRVLIFFDQDTVFDRSTLDFIEEFHAKNAEMAAGYSAIVFNAKREKMFKDVLLARSSGSLFFLENLKKINWHNEKYFVDCVDYEFCLRSSNNGLKIGECSGAPGFDHESEQPDVERVIFGKKFLMRKYSASRMLDATLASLRLLAASIRDWNLPMSYAVLRSLVIYISFQFLARIMNITGREKSH